MIDADTGTLRLDLDGLSISSGLTFDEFAQSVYGTQFADSERLFHRHALKTFGVDDLYHGDEHFQLAGQFLNGVLFRWTLIRAAKCKGIVPEAYLDDVRQAFDIPMRQDLLASASTERIRLDAECLSMLETVFGGKGEATGIWRRPWGWAALNLVGFQFHVIYHPEWLNCLQ